VTYWSISLTLYTSLVWCRRLSAENRFNGRGGREVPREDRTQELNTSPPPPPPSVAPCRWAMSLFRCCLSSTLIQPGCEQSSTLLTTPESTFFAGARTIFLTLTWIALEKKTLHSPNSLWPYVACFFLRQVFCNPTLVFTLRWFRPYWFILRENIFWIRFWPSLFVIKQKKKKLCWPWIFLAIFYVISLEISGQMNDSIESFIRTSPLTDTLEDL
jgi:hypothetical protein